MWRSLLFVPTLNARLVEGAPRRGADMITLDLEAAVAMDRKAEARAALGPIIRDLRGAGLQVSVRINGPETCGKEDIEVAVSSGAEVIVLPSATSETVQWAAEHAGPKVALIPLIEDPDGVFDAREIARAAPSVAALGFGVEDYANAMGAPPTTTLLEPAAAQVIQAARACGKAPLVVPDSIADYRDLARFEAAARRARALGSSGGFAIHPDQVSLLNKVFSPAAEDLEWAQKIVDAAETARSSGQAVASLDGQMIDAPVEMRARAILKQRGA